MTTELRVLIADDHPMIRRGLVSLLTSSPGIVVVGEAGSGAETLARAEVLGPDVVVIDLQMPEGGGIETTRELVRRRPATRVLVVTLFDDDDSIFAALRAGASGYVLKDADEDELLRAVAAVGRGEAIFSPAVATRVLGFFAATQHAAPRELFPTLTEREREILQLIAEGRSNGQIATRLSLRHKTVANYVSTIFTKLQVADRAEAIVRARERGLHGG